jgi:hypothetical protein
MIHNIKKNLKTNQNLKRYHLKCRSKQHLIIAWKIIISYAKIRVGFGP